MSSFHGNWVDLVILLVFAYYIAQAFRADWWAVLSEFLSFLLSLFLALRGYSWVAEFLRTHFSLNHSIANAGGFLLIAGVSQIGFSLIFAEIASRIPQKYWRKPWSHALATFPALGEGIIMVSFFLTLVMGLPISSTVKADIGASKIGGVLLSKTSMFEAKLNDIFGGVLKDSFVYITTKEGSKESLSVRSDLGALSTDSESETEMFKLLNSERKKQGIAELTWRNDLVPVARAHATDMWRRNYFSHYSIEGKSVADRLKEAHISFGIVGENLAMAGSLEIAHSGLMNSQGHRENILNPEFKRIGIGVIDDGIYGKMFVQVFTD